MKQPYQAHMSYVSSGMGQMPRPMIEGRNAGGRYPYGLGCAKCLMGHQCREMIGAESEPVGEKRKEKMELKSIVQRSGDWI